MAYEYERLMGYVADLVGGDGTRQMAKYIDCPKCGSPLDIIVVDDDEITLTCTRDAAHMSWHGFYEHLPAWINEYKTLNI